MTHNGDPPRPPHDPHFPAPTLSHAAEPPRGPAAPPAPPARPWGRGGGRLGGRAPSRGGRAPPGPRQPPRPAGGPRRYSRTQLGLAARLRGLLDDGHPLASAETIVGLQDQLADARAVADRLRADIASLRGPGWPRNPRGV